MIKATTYIYIYIFLLSICISKVVKIISSYKYYMYNVKNCFILVRVNYVKSSIEQN